MEDAKCRLLLQNAGRVAGAPLNNPRNALPLTDASRSASISQGLSHLKFVKRALTVNMIMRPAMGKLSRGIQAAKGGAATGLRQW